MKDELSEEIHGNMIIFVYMYKYYKYDITLLQKKPKMIFSIKNTKQEIWLARQGICGLSSLEKTNSIALLEVKILAENPCQEGKIDYFPKIEGLLTQKSGKTSIRCLVYSQRLHC